MRCSFVITGQSSLLMHADNVLASDDLSAWRKDPSHKSVSVAGDDRSPPWTWMAYLYACEKGIVCMPAETVMVALRFAGAKMIMRRQETFKAATQSGILIDEEFLPVSIKGRTISMTDVMPLKHLTFAEQAAKVKTLGFKLDVRRAVVGTSKHVRVRPRFDIWSLSGAMEINEPAITMAVLEQLFEIAGKRAGLGDWRPSARASGPHGRFTVSLKELD